MRLGASSGSDDGAGTLSWNSMMSSKQDLDRAVEEVLDQVAADGISYKLVIFHVSTIYEASSQKYDTIFEQIKSRVPGCEIVLGSTTGAVIGPETPFGEPIELEGRAGFSLTLGNFDSDVELSTFSLEKEEMYEYIRNPQTKLRKDGQTDATSVMVFTTDQCKPYLADFFNQLETREGGEAFGAIASSVTSLHQPKVFISGDKGDIVDGWKKSTIGAVGLVLGGNVEVKTISARSCLAVGPVYEVRQREGRELLGLVPVGGSINDMLSPLEALDRVIKSIPYDYADALKRELLVGAIKNDLKEDEKAEDRIFYGQKPITFDPISGSLTLSSIPGGAGADKLLFRFCIRDTVTAQNDLESANRKVSQFAASSNPLACLVLGSMERGNKMFRYGSWESSKLYSSLGQAKLAQKVPMAGMYSQGSFGKLAVDAEAAALGVGAGKEAISLVEADSLYAFFVRKSDQGVPSTPLEVEAAMGAGAGAGAGEVGINNRDVCSAFEEAKYNDEEDMVVVEKRDPESAAPVRVATMDYVIPEKSPQPSNVLESMVWDREQAVDRLRERFQMTKALMQATRSELKFPVRKLGPAIANLGEGDGNAFADGTLSLIVEFNRASLHNGKITEESMGDSDVSRLAAAKAQIGQFSAGVELLEAEADSLAEKGVRVAAVGAHLDVGTFRGSYEDLENLRETESGKARPVIANDFVLYAYQLFKAKSSGADAIKLHASILPPTEISYMAKIAKKINLSVVVVVSSVPQLLAVLDKVPELENLSVSSRNMQLWKLAPGKARKILDNEEVRLALAAKRTMALANDEDNQAAGASSAGLTVMMEGLSTPAEIVQAREDPLVDGVFLGEELVSSRLPIHEAVKAVL